MQLTPANYHSPEANREYMSWHQLQHWLACPSAEAARQRGEYVEEPTEALLVGSYVDRAILTPAELPGWLAEHEAEVFKGRGDKREMRAAFVTADRMVERLLRDPLAVELLDGEHQACLTGEIHGCPWRGALDVLKRDAHMIVDLKTAPSFEDGWRVIRDAQGDLRNVRCPWYDVHNYWGQLAVYRELCRQTFGAEFLPMLVAVTKQDPPDIGAWTFEDTDRLDFEISHIGAEIGQVMAYKRGDAEPRRCESCAWCRQTKRLTVVSAKAK